MGCGQRGLIRLSLGKRRLNQPVRAEPVEAVANPLIRRERISTSSMRTDLIGVSLGRWVRLNRHARVSRISFDKQLKYLFEAVVHLQSVRRPRLA